jgi:hypothetical protein
VAFTYSLLAESTIGVSGASTITFNNIPQNYTDLVLYTSLRDSASNVSTNYYITINNSNTSIYSRKNIYGTGTAVGTTTETTGVAYIGYSNSNTATVNTFGNGMTYIPNYTSSNYKSISSETVAESNTVAVSMALTAGLYSSPTAVTSVQIKPWTGPFLQYSTATLYGIRIEL